jgi:hypothetical protein
MRSGGRASNERQDDGRQDRIGRVEERGEENTTGEYYILYIKYYSIIHYY